MSVTIALLLAAGVVFEDDPKSPPDPPSLWDEVPDGTLVEYCPWDATTSEGLQQAFDDLDEDVRALRPDADAAPVLARLRDLLKTPCLRPAMAPSIDALPESALSLRTWWVDGGGFWLSSFLPVAGGRVVDRIYLPPDVRPLLSDRTRPGGELAPFVCAPGDAACAASTAAWQERARRRLWREWSWSPDDVARWHACTEAVSDPSEAGAYLRWRVCLESAWTAREAMPLITIRAPGSGWLVVSGRRGHYEFCDETRFYDLRTGSAFVASACSKLFLRPGGAVDARATRKRSTIQVREGSVSREHLHELVWWLLLRPELFSGRVMVEAVPLPTGLRPAFVKGSGPARKDRIIGGEWNSARTTLDWHYVTRSGTLEGRVSWPDASRLSDAHATDLLAVVDAGFREGCAAARPPSSLLSEGKAPSVSPIDASEEVVREIGTRLRHALNEVIRRRCRR